MNIKLSDKEILNAFKTFFIDDGYSFCLSDNRLKSVCTAHIEKTPKLSWCQLKLSNCSPKTHDIRVSPQSTKKFIIELNKFNFKTLKTICKELNLEDTGTKLTLKKRLVRVRINHIITGAPILAISKI